MTTSATTSGPVAPETLRDELAERRPPRVIDVRTPAEFAAAHVPGSWNVPLDQLREHRDDLAARLGDADDRGTVLVCRSGARATRAEQVLAATGLPEVRVLAGGMSAWEAAGAPVTRGREAWALERQVRLVAGSLVATSVLASSLAPRAKWLAAAVGSGLTVAALTDTCAMGSALSRMPWNRGVDDAVDVDDVLASLARPAG